MNKIVSHVSMILAVAMSLVACNSDDIKDDAMYTFTGETATSFCANKPELSRFYEMLMRFV